MMQSVGSVLGHGGLLVLLLVTIWDTARVSAKLTRRDGDVCETKACEHAATTLENNMDTNVEPCDNFYDYACGGWIDSHQIPEESGYIGQIYLMNKKINKIANDLLTADDVTGSQQDVFQKPRKFYSSCMNISSIEGAGKQPLLTHLQQLGGWPLIDDTWSPNNFNLTATLAKLMMFDSCHLFLFGPWNDLDNSTVMALSLHQPYFYGIGSRESYFTPKTEAKLAAYRNTILTVVQKFKGTAASEQDVNDMMEQDVNDMMEQDVNDMMAFEMELVNISRPWADIDNEPLSYRNNRYTVAKMDTDFPLINWSVFFNMIFAREEVGIPIPRDELVINYVPNYFTRLQNLLQRTDKKIIANLLMWRTALNFLPYLSHEYQMIDLNLRKVLSGEKELRDRGEKCSEVSREEFGKILGNIYVRQYVASTTKQQVELMVDDLKKAFSEQVNESDWMDAKTKRKALEKNEAMNKAVAYSDEILDVNYLTEYYQRVIMEEGQYFNNSVNLMRETINRDFKELRKIQDKQKVEVEPMVVNAQQMFEKNAIGIFAGILQPPFFNAENPKYMNYAAIGMVIGHEITHGFDNNGRAYDKHGNAVDWWTNNSNAEFQKRTKCFINQYNGFTSPKAEANLNGENTLPENVGDCGGIRQAYRAYRNWVKEHNNEVEEKPLPRLGLTADKLFFISYAQVWCAKFTPEKAQAFIENNVHSEHRFRVIGPLQNSEDFARAFNCPINSTMNPETKCVIW